jgi:hypothetical protein
MVPKAIERGGQFRAEVALENIQCKCQSLFKAMKRKYKKFYLLPFKDVDHPLNRDCVTVIKPGDIPLE